MKGKWCRLLLPMAMFLLLTGCLFRSPDDLYKLPDVPEDYDRLKMSINAVRTSLSAEYGTSTEVAVIVSGDNTATIQLQDLDNDGRRESAITFLKVPGVEKGLKIYVFAPDEEDYQVAGVVEGDGTAIYSVDYVDLNGSGTKELVVCWQISTGVYQLGAYTLDDLDHSNPSPSASSGKTERSELLSTQLLLTGCSVANDGTTVTSGYRLLDFDQDTRTEIAIVRLDSGGVGSLVEVYGWKDGAFISLDSASLSAGVTTLSRIRSNYLQGELYPPALYISSNLDDGRRVIDVVAYQTVEYQETRDLVNLSLGGDGVSRDLLQGYTEVGLTDINDDYVLELPNPTALPTYGELNTTDFWLIDWVQYGEAGQRRYVETTYHNVKDSWYLEIPENWKDKITISRNDQVSGQREVIFSRWKSQEEAPRPFLSIYRLTGNNRTTAANQSGRFVLREEESVIYAAKFHESGWNCGMDEADLLNSFNTIQTSWYYD